ncbi:MAG: D-alanyl-D-alanine carboxypeptidase family protein [Bacillota bacterium]|nr:D-alanyl-D-alanine carboxypeptidase family protein [Bacillota bacterium]
MNRIIHNITIYLVIAIFSLMGAVPAFASETVFDGAAEPPETSATSVMLMDAGNGEILYEKDAYEKRDPASITKILNCLVCLDTLDFDQEVTVDIDPETEGSIMKLKKGETLRIEDIVYGMMLWSANDGAEFLGHLAGEGDMKAFCDMMNAKARDLGAKDTKYVNPNGLNGAAVNNVTTAYDIAVIVKEAMKDERFRQIVGTQEYVIGATNKYKERKLTNSNMCLWSDDIRKAAEGDPIALDEYEEAYRSNPYNYIGDDDAAVRNAARDEAKQLSELMYKPCIGVKTGYSSTAGDCFAGFAKKGNTEIIAVVLNAPHTKNKFQDAKKLWKYSYDNFKTYTAQASSSFEYQLAVKRGALREVELGMAEDLKVTTLKKDDPSATVTTELKLPEEKPMAPIHKGDVMGQIVASYNGEEVERLDLISMETCEEGGILSYIGIADEDAPKFLALAGTALITLIIIIALIRRSRSRRR